MGIDHVIDYACAPKQAFSALGLLNLLKARQRANTIIKLYRDNGDMRPPSDMGFEMVRRNPDGEEEVQVIIVQDLLNQAALIDPYEKFCDACPANLARRPFGCFNNLNYPISQAGELWLLKQLATPDQPLVFLLLQQAMQDLKLDIDYAAQIRGNPGVIVETSESFGKRYDEFTITSDHVFQMLFFAESIQPRYGAMLMLLFGAISREMSAQDMMQLTPADGSRPIEFLLQPEEGDDETIKGLKLFFAAIHRAHAVNVGLSLDV